MATLQNQESQGLLPYQLQPSGSFVAKPFPLLQPSYPGFGAYSQPIDNAYYPQHTGTYNPSLFQSSLANPGPYGTMDYQQPNVYSGSFGAIGLPMPQLNLFPPSGSFTLNGGEDKQMMDSMGYNLYGGTQAYGASGSFTTTGPFVFYPTFDDYLNFEEKPSVDGNHIARDSDKRLDQQVIPDKLKKSFPKEKHGHKTRDAKIQKKKPQRRGCC